MLLAGLAAAPAFAQEKPAPQDPMVTAVSNANFYFGMQFTKVMGMMSEEDYAFRPTPEVRTLGQLLAHIADSNYHFCSAANREKPAVQGIEKGKTGKAEIDAALSASFALCSRVLAAMTGDKGKAMVPFGKSPMPALAVVMYSSMHTSQHYGNVITYIRLRGKVPPPAPQ